MKLALRVMFFILIVGTLGAVAWILHADKAYGPRASFSLLSGAAFGFLLQRSRFCWFCNVRDLVEKRDGRGVVGIITALVVGTLGYAAILGGWVADPSGGFLPNKGFIGPVSWVVAAGGLVFGIGMSLSGSCISAHLYRLGEGSVLSPLALVGVVLGSIAGYALWDWLYLRALQEAKVVWLPTYMGYAGSLAIQLGVLGLAVVLIVRYRLPRVESPEFERSWSAIARAVFVDRWPAWLGGVLIGMLAVLVLVRTQPLGVTAEISRISRDLGTSVGLLEKKMLGMDHFAGCRATETSPTWGNNALFVGALILASLGSAVLAGQFRPRWEKPRAMIAALLGGVLLGLGALVSTGCSVGTAMSGVMALAVSGWIFLLMMLIGMIGSLRVRKWIG